MLQTQSQQYFSHQYPQADPSWLQQQHHHQAQHAQQAHHQQQHSSLAAQQHAQAQAAAAAAAAAQQQHYNRIAMAGAGSAGVGLEGAVSDENRKVFMWVAELLDPNRRETALMELSKKREQVPELALVIWHSFGMDWVPLS